MTSPDDESIATLLMRSLRLDRYTAEAACQNVLTLLEIRVFSNRREILEDYPDVIRELLQGRAEVPFPHSPMPPPAPAPATSGRMFIPTVPPVPAPPPVSVVSTGAPKSGKSPFTPGTFSGPTPKRLAYDEFYALRDAANESRKLMEQLKEQLAEYARAHTDLVRKLPDSDPTKRPPADPAKRKPKRPPKSLKK